MIRTVREDEGVGGSVMTSLMYRPLVEDYDTVLMYLQHQTMGFPEEDSVGSFDSDDSAAVAMAAKARVKPLRRLPSEQSSVATVRTRSGQVVKRIIPPQSTK